MASLTLTTDLGKKINAKIEYNPIINGKSLDAQRIVDAINLYYPKTLTAYENEDVYLNKPFFVGIRTKSCGVSGVKGGVVADDVFVMLRRQTNPLFPLTKEWIIEYYPMTTDPTAAYRQKPIAGQNKTGYLIARNWKPTEQIPEFCGHYLYQIGNYANSNALVCRTEQNVWQLSTVAKGKQQIPEGMTVDAYAKQIKLAPSRYQAGMFIHRSWGDLMFNDSAGCQVFKDNNDLTKIFNLCLSWQIKMKKAKKKFSKFFDYILVDADMIL
jgi:hypothetical protein